MKTCDRCTWPEVCQTSGWCHRAEEKADARLHPTAGSEVCAGDGYRLLIPGERLQKHDEGLHEEDGQWHEVGWLFSACDYVPGFMVPIRRKIDTQNDQVKQPT
jgi:hypothetical protein